MINLLSSLPSPAFLLVCNLFPDGVLHTSRPYRGSRSSKLEPKFIFLIDTTNARSSLWEWNHIISYLRTTLGTISARHTPGDPMCH